MVDFGDNTINRGFLVDWPAQWQWYACQWWWHWLHNGHWWYQHHWNQLTTFTPVPSNIQCPQLPHSVFWSQATPNKTRQPTNTVSAALQHQKLVWLMSLSMSLSTQLGTQQSLEPFLIPTTAQLRSSLHNQTPDHSPCPTWPAYDMYHQPTQQLWLQPRTYSCTGPSNPAKHAFPYGISLPLSVLTLIAHPTSSLRAWISHHFATAFLRFAKNNYWPPYLLLTFISLCANTRYQSQHCNLLTPFFIYI